MQQYEEANGLDGGERWSDSSLHSDRKENNRQNTFGYDWILAAAVAAAVLAAAAVTVTATAETVTAVTAMTPTRVVITVEENGGVLERARLKVEEAM